MNYERLYEFRFRDVNSDDRQGVWNVIAADVHQKMRRPRIVLDAAGGSGEFINGVPAEERWVVDRVSYGEIDSKVKVVIGDVLEVELPTDHFEGIFVSNVLEHLPTQEAVAELLGRLRGFLRPGGVIAIMGPNFRYCAKEYFDCADHTLALTHVSVEEHLYAAGFNIMEVRRKYLPYSFRSRLPANPKLTAAYLRMTALQSILGKQFLVVADRS
jgi:SAM-dependent methyltransferase